MEILRWRVWSFKQIWGFRKDKELTNSLNPIQFIGGWVSLGYDGCMLYIDVLVVTFDLTVGGLWTWQINPTRRSAETNGGYEALAEAGWLGCVWGQLRFCLCWRLRDDHVDEAESPHRRWRSVDRVLELFTRTRLKMESGCLSVHESIDGCGKKQRKLHGPSGQVPLQNRFIGWIMNLENKLSSERSNRTQAPNWQTAANVSGEKIQRSEVGSKHWRDSREKLQISQCLRNQTRDWFPALERVWNSGPWR